MRGRYFLLEWVIYVHFQQIRQTSRQPGFIGWLVERRNHLLPRITEHGHDINYSDIIQIA